MKKVFIRVKNNAIIISGDIMKSERECINY